MKKIAIVPLFLALLAFSWPVFAESESKGLLEDLGIEVNADVSVYSQYVWRGFILDRDAVLQPGFYITSPKSKLGRVKVGVWSSHDLQNEDTLSSKEYDYIIDYTYPFKSLSFSFGHTYYDFPDTDTFSREFYAGVAFPGIPLSPSVFYYRDYGLADDGGGSGSYTLISTAYSFPLKDTSLSLDLGARLGLNHELFINGDGGDLGLKAGLTVPLTKNLNFSPNLNYSIPFGDVSSDADGNQKSRFYGGATFTYTI